MVTPELIAFISQQLSNGVSIDQIKQALQSSNWSMDDINASFVQLQIPINLNQPIIAPTITSEQHKIKNKIPWYFIVGIIIPPVFMVVSIIGIFIQTNGFKTGMFSTSIQGIHGPSTPTLVQVKSMLTEAYPKANIDFLLTNAKDLQSGKSTSILLVTIEMENKLTAIDRKNVAIQICNIYSTNHQQLDLLDIWSSSPKLFGIIPVESPDKDSIEERSCPDWINKPVKI